MGIAAAAITLLIYWLCHVAWFRASWPKSPLKVLLRLLLAGCVLYCVLALWILPAAGLSLWAILGGSSYFWLGLLMYVASVLAYIVVYSGVEVESPSLRIVMTIAAYPGGAMPHDALRDMFNDERVILPRLNDMISSNLIFARDGVYVLSPSGERLATLFRVYRGLLGRDTGG